MRSKIDPLKIQRSMQQAVPVIGSRFQIRPYPIELGDHTRLLRVAVPQGGTIMGIELYDDKPTLFIHHNTQAPKVELLMLAYRAGVDEDVPQNIGQIQPVGSMMWRRRSAASPDALAAGGYEQQFWLFFLVRPAPAANKTEQRLA